MTFSYSKRVSSVHLLGFARLLFIWRASIYKLVFREILIYCALYGCLSVLYRLILSSEERKLFEQVVVFCSTLEGTVPLTFILGFYVTYVANRWWQQLMSMSWPDRIMAYISTMIEGDSKRAIMIRRTLMRYLFLSQCILMSSVSKPVRKRFPEMQSFVEHGIMTEAELEAINDEHVPTISNKYWIPTQWFASLLVRARKENFIRDSFSFNTLLNELATYKKGLGKIIIYDMVNVPLSYTQVATISVYLFFVTTFLSRQFIEWTSVQEQYKEFASSQYKIDMYFPIFTILQLFFYVGWLKVAEQMLNPFGEDDDDFECNWILDRNFKVGFCAVDFHYNNHPPLEEDEFMDTLDPNLSYTVASERYRLPNGWHGSMHNLTVTNQSYEMIRPRVSNQNCVEEELYNHTNIDGIENYKTSLRRFSSIPYNAYMKLLKKNRSQLPLFMREVMMTEERSPESQEDCAGCTQANCYDPCIHARSQSLTAGILRLNSSNSSAFRVEKLKYIVEPVNCESADEIEMLHNDSSTDDVLEPNCCDSPKEIVVNWISDEKNKFSEKLLSNSYLSCSACQLFSDNDHNISRMVSKESSNTALPIFEKQHFGGTAASVGNLSDVEVNLQIENNFNDGTDEDQYAVKRVAFEPVL